MLSIKEINTGVLTNVDHVESFTVEMEKEFKSIVYRFVAKENKQNQLVIFHEGHGNLLEEKSMSPIKWLLEEGYDVLVFHMPGLPPNTPLMNHNELGEINLEQGNPMKFFVEPVIVVLNYIERNYHYKHIDMTGISGGGWTTYLVAAIDTRIEYSFPTAGGYPLYLRKGPCTTLAEWSDYESNNPIFYKHIASYLDLYILGAYGEGRKQVQILNKYDGKSFGIKYKTYENAVQNVESDWSVFSDTNNLDHSISEDVMKNVILPLLNR